MSARPRRRLALSPTLLAAPALVAPVLAAPLLAVLAGPAIGQDTLLDPVVLTGERGDGPVDGLVAARSRAGTKSDTPILRTPASVDVVPARQMEDQAAQSVAQALRYTPGIFTEYRGASNMSDEMYIRGFGYVPRYIDGLRFDLGAGVHSQIDPWMLDRVEVVKGPASVLYGQASPGGIVNMVTKRADGERHRRVQGTAGDRATAEAAMDIGDRVAGREDLSWRVVASARRADTQEEGLETRGLSVMPSLRWEVDADTAVTLSLWYQREPDAGYRNFREALGSVWPTRYGMIPADFLVGDPDYERYSRTQTGLALTFEHQLAPEIRLRQNLRLSSADIYQRTLVWGSLLADERTITRSVTQSKDEARQLALDTQILATLPSGWGEHALLGGLDLRHTRRDSTVDRAGSVDYGGTVPSIDWRDPVYGHLPAIALSPSSDYRQDTSQIGLYAQDQITAGDLTVSLGGRYDWFESQNDDHLAGATTDLSDGAFTGRAGILYTFANGLAPYASYSTSFEPVLEAPAAGQDPFKPTEAAQAEIGVKWGSADGRTLLTAALFDITQQNVLTRETWTLPYRQIGEIRSRGLELEARSQVTRAFEMIAAYSYLDAEVTRSDVAEEQGRTPSRLPAHQAAIWGKYTFAGGWNLGLGLRHLGRSWGDAANTFELGSATLVDLAVGYDFARWGHEGLRAQLNVQNLGDRSYVASCASAYACFMGTERRVLASLDYRW